MDIMTDDVIYCPGCKEKTKFMRVEKYVRIYELSSNDFEKIFVVQCEECGYPIGVYPQPIYTNNENTK